MATVENAWGIRTDTSSVRGWSRSRLGFEPRAAMVAYRAGLRRKLHDLDPVAGLALVVGYAAPDDDFVDVENAALYNIGVGAYAHLMTHGLYCARTTSPDSRHHLSYALEPLPDLPLGPVLSRLEIDVPARTDKPGGWWAAFRSAALGLSRPALHEGAFAIDIAAPYHWSATKTANLIKPLLDGVISALHTHDGSCETELMSRIESLGRPESVWAILCDPAYNLLGARPVLRPYRSGVAWNPADERCLAFRVRQRTDSDSRLTAVISAISPEPSELPSVTPT